MRPDLSTEWADLRLGRAELRPKSPERPKKADLRLGRAELRPKSPERPKKANLRPKGPGLMPERHDLKPDSPV